MATIYNLCRLNLSFPNFIFKHFFQAEFIADEHACHRADYRLQDLIREFEQRIFRRAVNKRASQRITYDHDNCTDCHADSGGQHRMLFKGTLSAQ